MMEPAQMAEEIMQVFGDRLTASRERARYAEQIAGKLRGWASESHTDSGTHTTAIYSRSPAAKLQEQAIIDAIQPQIRELRQLLFSSDEPKFRPDEYADAVRWLDEEHARTWQPVTEEDWQRADTLRADAAEKLRDIVAITGGQYSINYEPARLVFGPAPGEPVRRLNVSPRQSFFQALAFESQDIAHQVGCFQWDIIAYVLAGIPPRIPAWKLQTGGRGVGRRGPGVDRPTSTIELNPLFLKDPEKELRQMVKQLRNQESAKERNDRALVLIVERVGGVPEAAPLGFWRDHVLPLWKGAGMKTGKDEVKAARALQARYYRLPESERSRLGRSA